jgi:hypothetical protein
MPHMRSGVGLLPFGVLELSHVDSEGAINLTVK